MKSSSSSALRLLSKPGHHYVAGAFGDRAFLGGCFGEGALLQVLRDPFLLLRFLYHISLLNHLAIL